MIAYINLSAYKMPTLGTQTLEWCLPDKLEEVTIDRLDEKLIDNLIYSVPMDWVHWRITSLIDEKYKDKSNVWSNTNQDYKYNFEITDLPHDVNIYIKSFLKPYELLWYGVKNILDTSNIDASNIFIFVDDFDEDDEEVYLDDKRITIEFIDLIGRDYFLERCYGFGDDPGWDACCDGVELWMNPNLTEEFIEYAEDKLERMGVCPWDWSDSPIWKNIIHNPNLKLRWLFLQGAWGAQKITNQYPWILSVITDFNEFIDDRPGRYNEFEILKKDKIGTMQGGQAAEYWIISTEEEWKNLEKNPYLNENTKKFINKARGR